MTFSPHIARPWPSAEEGDRAVRWVGGHCYVIIAERFDRYVEVSIQEGE